LPIVELISGEYGLLEAITNANTLPVQNYKKSEDFSADEITH
jgi:hypothetical protein